MTSTHLWVRAEERENERRVGITPEGVKTLISDGIQVTVEDSPTRIIGIDRFISAGATPTSQGTWRDAPEDAYIFGLKELPDDGTPLIHRHIFFGHAFKGQAEAPALLNRFGVGGGTLLDLEYLTDTTGRRLAAFGFWAGYVGAALSVATWAGQQVRLPLGAVSPWESKEALILDLTDRLARAGHRRPTALIIGALGRTGTGARALLEVLGIPPTGWDMAETAHGGPFPQILDHDLFLNCILASDGVPVFVPQSAITMPRRLSVIGDIACDPNSPYNPIPIYDQVTTWDTPTRQITAQPPLDVMAIDNLPSLLPLESSEDFAGQLLPLLRQLPTDPDGVWARAGATFQAHT